MPFDAIDIHGKPGETLRFEFDFPVLQYAVGISYWSFTFGQKDHHIQTVALSLETSQPSDQHITCKVNGILHDDSGHYMDTGDSKVIVSCIALLETGDQNTVLANANAIPNGGMSPPIQLPGTSLKIGQPFLSGFSLSYGAGDHHLRRLLATAGFIRKADQGEITGKVSMSDDSGKTAQSATINGGLIASNPQEGGILVLPVLNKQTTESFDVPYSGGISNAVVLIQDMQMQYAGDHHVKTIGAGTSASSPTSGGVRLENARAFVEDHSGHKQVDASSSVNMAVVIVPSV